VLKEQRRVGAALSQRAEREARLRRVCSLLSLRLFPPSFLFFPWFLNFKQVCAPAPPPSHLSLSHFHFLFVHTTLRVRARALAQSADLFEILFFSKRKVGTATNVPLLLARTQLARGAQRATRQERQEERSQRQGEARRGRKERQEVFKQHAKGTGRDNI
jgi:hypothetical protein